MLLHWNEKKNRIVPTRPIACMRIYLVLICNDSDLSLIFTIRYRDERILPQILRCHNPIQRKKPEPHTVFIFKHMGFRFLLQLLFTALLYAE